MNTRTTTRKANEALDSLCYVCGAAVNTRLFVNNLCPSCCTPTTPGTTLDATCDRIVEHNPISGTHALRAAHAVLQFCSEICSLHCNLSAVLNFFSIEF